MLCAACWHETPDDTTACAACAAPPLLAGRYRLDRKLGQGATGIAFAATRVSDGLGVCVKGLAYRGMTSFEAERLFHREATVLRQLRHPQVPAYIDDLSLGSGPSFALYLVQELVIGDDLETERARRRPTLTEVVAIADELLGIVAHLHALTPPIVHRDIKLRNVMRRAADGRLVLVDFGAVKEVVQASFDPGLSVQGTYGYMAPEQLRGEASPRSDLYAIGVVTLALLTGREPSSLMDAAHRLDWHRYVSLDAPLVSWLERMTAADPADRFANAEDARRALESAMAAPPVTAPSAPPVTPSAPPAPSAPAPLYEIEPASSLDTPAMTSSRPRPWLVPLAFLGAAVAILVLVLSAREDEHETKVAAMAAPRVSCDGACRPLTTPFKDRLTFGMSIDQARAARPDLASATAVAPLAGTTTEIERVGLELARDMPALPSEAATERLCMRSELVGLEARCCFDFMVGLGRLSCITEDGFPVEALDGMVLQVERIFGPADTRPQPRNPYHGDFFRDDVTWLRGSASLRIAFPYAMSGIARMERPTVLHHFQMTQAAPAWQDELDRLATARARADAAARAQAEAARLRELERQREERKKLGLPPEPL